MHPHSPVIRVPPRLPAGLFLAVFVRSSMNARIKRTAIHGRTLQPWRPCIGWYLAVHLRGRGHRHTLKPRLRHPPLHRVQRRRRHNSNPKAVRRSPMSSASLAVAARPHPEAARVVALSAAIALNLAALLILTRPLAPQVLALVHKLASVPQVVFIESPPKVPQPPPIELKPLPHPPAAPVLVQPRPSVAPPVLTTSVEGTQAMPTVAPPSAAPADTAAPVEATLAYRSAPLRFPAQALRQPLQGTVLLRVLVDESGAP